MIYLLLMLALAGPSNALATQAGLDVNDVSMLFPLNGTKPNPEVGFDFADSDGNPLLSQKIYSELQKFSNRAQLKPHMGLYKEWRIVSLRFDPCAPDPNRSCIQQLRLIAQYQGTEDASIHLTYDLAEGLPREDDPKILRLLEIKTLSEERGASTTGRTLNVHPGMELDARNGKQHIIGAVKEFIQENASQEKLRRVTAVLRNLYGAVSWFFFGGIVEKGSWKPEPIPNTNGSLLMSFNYPSAVLRPLPQSHFPSTERFLRNKVVADADKIGLHILENPQLTSTHTADCISCHSSSYFTQKKGDLFFGHSDAFVTPVGITGFAELRLSNAPKPSVHLNKFSYTANYRNFGYDGTRPTITSLTANSSALAAELVNRSQGWSNPSSLDCSHPRVKACFSGLSPSFKSGSEKECLSLCKPR